MTSLRLKTQFAFILLALSGLGFRLFYIQVLHGLTYARRGQKQFVKKVTNESHRGNILDRNGNVLATTIESQSVFVHPKEWSESGGDAKLLQAALSIDP